MSYVRVIPRDLFNEANLLKCLGRLWIETERYQPRRVTFEHDGEAFVIVQSEDDGTLRVANVEVRIGGRVCTLRRPLNSRRAWPLYLYTEDENEIGVFTDDGCLSADMLALIQNSQPQPHKETE